MQENQGLDNKKRCLSDEDYLHTQKQDSICPHTHRNEEARKMPKESQNRFVKMPLCLYGDGEYSNLSPDAKILYAMLRDRQELANRFNKPELNGRRPIFYSVQEAMKLLNHGNKKTIKVFRELEDAHLIIRIRQGQSRPSKIYVRDILETSHPQYVSK